MFCLELGALNTIFIHVLILKWDYSESHFLCLVVKYYDVILPGQEILALMLSNFKMCIFAKGTSNCFCQYF